MTNTNPLRAEFVLTGLALLASITGLVLAVQPELFHGVRIKDVEHLAVPLTIGAIAAGYVVGIVVVQLTFFIPTQLLIKRVRTSRFADLNGVETHLASNGLEMEPSPDVLGVLLAKAFGSGPVIRDNEHERALVLTVGRAFAPAQLTDEYKYRRANRQVFVGMLPSAIVGAVAGGFALWLSWWIVGVIMLFLIALGVIWRSARYQEEIAQSLILDVAFLRRLGIDARTIERRGAVDEQLGGAPSA